MKKYFATMEQSISEREIRNAKRVRGIAAESMVVLENNGVLPLNHQIKTVALFGNGARRTVKGGTGSGDVNSRFVTSIEAGFEEAGIEITTKDWLDRFDHVVDTEKKFYCDEIKKYIATEGQLAFLRTLNNPFQEPPVINATEEELVPADVAVYVLARNSGEGSDRLPLPGQYDLYEEEKELIQILREKYQKLIIVLNIGGVIDTKFLRLESGADAILFMGQVGNIGGDALVDVLYGNQYPSGHLTSTWAENYKDYPSANSYSMMSDSLDDSYYTEGIYVGYRYFDTFGVKPAYPFGYGKAYTTFDILGSDVVLEDNRIKIRTTIQNSGSQFPGKEVVQVYFSAPNGKLEKPYQELAAYGKTKQLKPGEEETLELTFPIEQMASYDEERACYILEAGTYYLRVGVHSRDTHIVAGIKVDEEIITIQTSNQIGYAEKLEVMSSKGACAYTYENEISEKQNVTILKFDSQKIKTIVYKPEEVKEEALKTDVTDVITAEDVRSGKYTLDELVAQLTVEEMAELCVGTARGGLGGESVIGAASAVCPGAAGDTTPILQEKRGIRNLILADGPAGLRLSTVFAVDKNGDQIEGAGESPLAEIAMLFGDIPKPDVPKDAIYHYQYCTAIPIATNLAQTWNVEALAEAGDIVGEEMEEFGVNVWLAPGMNIQKNPLCGRNFEYYSEDPFLSGTCAAAETYSVQRHREAGVSIKHFALNNQENNRMHNNAHVTERAAREIYLKGFEIAVKRSNPMSIMSSYNLINGVHSANHYGLLTNIARQEWGFEGFFVTDWGTTSDFDMNSGKKYKYGISSASECIRTGNDLIMPGSQADVDDIIKGITDENAAYKITIRDLQNCAKHLLKVILTVN